MDRLDQLARNDIAIALGDDVLDQVADLTLRLHQNGARRTGALLTVLQLRSYRERSDTEREGMRSAVKHVLAALVLLGIIDQPG